MQEGSFFLYSLSCFTVCRLCDDDHSNGCEVIPHGGFDLHFSNNEPIEHFFMCLLTLLYVFFGGMSV